MISPSFPLSIKRGIKENIVVSEAMTTGFATSFTPKKAASFALYPFSMYC